MKKAAKFTKRKRSMY
jgi:hypothetical protein